MRASSLMTMPFNASPW